MNYTKDQAARIDQVNRAARDFINLLIECPEYLSKTLPTQLVIPPVKDTLPIMAADLVAKLLTDHDYLVFYPNHVETADPPVEYVSDTYENEEEMEQHIQQMLQNTIQ